MRPPLRFAVIAGLVLVVFVLPSAVEVLTDWWWFGELGLQSTYRTMLGANHEAENLGARCIATMSIDQIFHGDRLPPSSGTPDILFFNVLNPVAGRANAAQSAIDLVQQARLFTETRFTIPASVSGRGAPIAFDGSKLGFFGHSQGGINGPIFLAVDDQAHRVDLLGRQCHARLRAHDQALLGPRKRALHGEARRRCGTARGREQRNRNERRREGSPPIGRPT